MFGAFARIETDAASRNVLACDYTRVVDDVLPGWHATSADATRRELYSAVHAASVAFEDLSFQPVWDFPAIHLFVSQRPLREASNVIGSSSACRMSQGSMILITPPQQPSGLAVISDTTNRAIRPLFASAWRTSFRVRSMDIPREVVPLTSTLSSRSPSRQRRSNGCMADTSITSRQSFE